MEFFPALARMFVSFWYIEAPKSMLAYFSSLNSSFLQLFSFQLLLKTFFKPWKNEYRQGLIGFSRAMGMVVKSCVLFVTLLFFITLLVLEGIIFIGFLVLPIATIGVLVYA